MRINSSLAVVAVVVLSIGAGAARAVSGPGANDNSKFVYTEAVDQVANNLTITFSEGGQKRFASVDYQATGQAETTQVLSGGQVVKQLLFPDPALIVLSPDADGRASGSTTLVVNPGPSPCLCGGSFRIDYTNVVLTNISSGHVYRLADVSLSSP